MTYFSNGTEMGVFTEQYCSRCVNYRERDWRVENDIGCPLTDLHFLLDCSAAINDDKPDHETPETLTRFVLDFLIERPDAYTHRCSMFVEDTATPDPNQGDLFTEES